MSAAAPRVGETLYVDSEKWPGPWTVEKVNPSTVVLKQEGRDRGLKCYKSSLLDEPVLGKPYEPVNIFACGEVVTWNSPQAGGDLFVVLADKGQKVNIAKLGGDNDRYWRVSNRRSLTVVTDLKAVLAG